MTFNTCTTLDHIYPPTPGDAPRGPDVTCYCGKRRWGPVRHMSCNGTVHRYRADAKTGSACQCGQQRWGLAVPAAAVVGPTAPAAPAAPQATPVGPATYPGGEL